MAGQRGGARPGAGRKSKEIKAELNVLLDTAWPLERRRKVIEKLADKAEEGDADAAKTLLAYAYGKPTERHEHTGEDGKDIQIVVRYGDKPHA